MHVLGHGTCATNDVSAHHDAARTAEPKQQPVVLIYVFFSTLHLPLLIVCIHKEARNVSNSAVLNVAVDN